MTDTEQFYNDMFREMEDAADRAVLIRLQQSCPYMREQERVSLWEAIITFHGTRAEARTRLNHYLDLKLLDTFGQLRKEKEKS